MGWQYTELKAKVCLTCQHFKCSRRVKVFGKGLCIEYDTIRGECRIFNNYPKPWYAKAGFAHFCHYTRWRSLPDE